MAHVSIKAALTAQEPRQNIHIHGWVRTRRDAKDFSFVEVNDGSCLASIQVIIDDGVADAATLRGLTTGASLAVDGDLVESPGKGQRWEVRATSVELVGDADSESYPLQKKRHSDEFLRQIAHLRPRTNKYGAIARIRSEAAFAVHEFFRERDFTFLPAPIITGSDCEGAGVMFRVSTLGPNPKHFKLDEPFAEDFFGQEAFLTVSGQLSAEVFACALGNVYTFGPTFRAENSNTPRHAAEFWMIEPEMAFCDLECNMDLAEAFLKHLVATLTTRCAADLDLFARFVDKELPKAWAAILDNDFARVTHAEAVDILSKAKQKFEYPVQRVMDLQTEHERYLTEAHFKRPVIVTDWPREIKAFYMRLSDDETTVGAMDVLLPRVGEIIGGSQREERLDVLEARMADLGLDAACYWWYAELRKYGSVPHSGFGMGFERFLMMLTGVTNIRDVIPFPRTPNNLEF